MVGVSAAVGEPGRELERAVERKEIAIAKWGPVVVFVVEGLVALVVVHLEGGTSPQSSVVSAEPLLPVLAIPFGAYRPL